MKPIDAADLYDQAANNIKDALEGKEIDQRVLSASIQLLTPIMNWIYVERGQGRWPNEIYRPDDKDKNDG